VREGSRLSCSTMRASGCGMSQRIPRFPDSRKRRRETGVSICCRKPDYLLGFG
jgi:hypothetical protein